MSWLDYLIYILLLIQVELLFANNNNGMQASDERQQINLN